MPLLAGVVVFAAHEAGRRPSRTLLAALGCATAGDVALMADGTLPFLVGMAAFLGCQVLLIISFVRAGSRPRLAVPLLYGVGLAVAVVVLWRGLGGLALPVSLYAVALTTMAVLAAGLGWRIGLGGLLFFASDLLLAVGLADVVHLSGPWVMLTYVVGLALIVTGWITRPAADATQSVEKVGAQGGEHGVVEAEAGAEVAVHAAVPDVRLGEGGLEVLRTGLQQRQDDLR
jgi:uncharacterized membrane protein YhhN